MRNFLVPYNLDPCSFSWFERISMTIILLNCVTLGMYEPCADSAACVTVRCRILEAFDHAIFVFFTVEMCIKVLAMGLVGKSTYLAETWNCLDMFIVITGSVSIYVAIYKVFSLSLSLIVGYSCIAVYCILLCLSGSC